MRACEICSSMSPIWQGNTLDGAAELILAECVVTVFENENILRTARGRRREQLEGGKARAMLHHWKCSDTASRHVGRRKLAEA